MTTDVRKLALDKRVIEHWQKHQALLGEVEEMKSDLLKELLDSLPGKWEGGVWRSDYPGLESRLKVLVQKNVNM
jgi:hypothetical protein